MNARKTNNAITLGWSSTVLVAAGMILLTSSIAEERVFAYLGVGSSLLGFSAGMGAVYQAVNGYFEE